MAQRQDETGTLVSVNADQARVKGRASAGRSQYWPAALRYAATQNEQSLRLLILLMALCCDPMAIAHAARDVKVSSRGAIVKTLAVADLRKDTAHRSAQCAVVAATREAVAGGAG